MFSVVWLFLPIDERYKAQNIDILAIHTEPSLLKKNLNRMQFVSFLIDDIIKAHDEGFSVFILHLFF